MMARMTPRRAFLMGRVSSDPPEGSVRPDSTPAAESHCLVHISRRAMACEFEVCLPAGRFSEDRPDHAGGEDPTDCPAHPNADETALEALDLVDTLEEQMSVFRPTSEISRINLLASQGPVEVEPRLLAILQQAVELSRETDGAYDITAGPLWEAWGFARRAAAVPTEAQIEEARRRVGSQFVELDATRRTIRFLRPGVRLNLGSIGKGYAVDRCVEHLLAHGVADFLVHGGNSSVAARGSPRPSSERRGWTVGIRDPLYPDRRLGELRLDNRALGTSGSQFQSFRHQGRRYGHILDPRTGWPAQGVLSATVLASTAARADALSTALYVLGPSAALDYCRRHPEIAAVLVCPAAQGDGREIHLAGLGPDTWTPAS